MYEVQFGLVGFSAITLILLYLNFLAWFNYAKLRQWSNKYEEMIERLGLPGSFARSFFGPTAYKWLHRVVLLFMLLAASIFPLSWLFIRLGIFE